MKLSHAQIEQTIALFDALPIAEDGRLAPELHKVFGDHTFFLNNTGLHVVDDVESSGESSREAKIVKLASWADEQKTALAPHDPEVTDITVAFDRAV